MSEPFLGQIACFGFNFPPKYWQTCAGQSLPIPQYTALYSLLGTQFGGDGRANFNLPNLVGQAPIGMGQGPGLQDYQIGASAGSDTVTLENSQLPAHNHNFNCTTDVGTTASVGGNQMAKSVKGGGIGAATTAFRYAPNPPTTAFATAAIEPTGGGGAHNNLQPYLALNFCIAMQGVYPQRQ